MTPDYGESKTPFVGPPTSPTTDPPAEANQIETAAKVFLGLYWQPGQRTYGQLANDLAGVATPDILAPWTDPAHASASAEAGAPVNLVSVTITSATPTSAVVSGEGTNTVSGAVVWRTVSLIQGNDSVWRVSAFL